MGDEKRILDKLDALAEDVTDLKVSVARLEEKTGTKPGLVRDGTITVSGGAIGAALLAILQHFAAK